MRAVHVRGMGVVGSFLVRELVDRGVPVTWWDDGSPSAWPASTGSVSAHSAGNNAGYGWWMEIGRTKYAAYVEEVRAVYVQKSRPVSLADVFDVRRQGSEWMDPRPALQVNVQEFVRDQRALYAGLEGNAPADAIVVSCRGVGDAGAVPVWGWSAPVALAAAPELLCDGYGRRKAYHVTDPERPQDRLYLYPIPMSSLWWAGSSTRLQKTPTRLDSIAAIEFSRFLSSMRSMFVGAIAVVVAGDILQGWRPKPRKWAQAAAAGALWYRDGAELNALPLYKSGVLLGPIAAMQIAHEVERL